MSSTPLDSLETVSLAERAYRALRDAIATGALSPGERITERGLAERLSVSATPIREAIKRLELDGLAERTSPRTVRIVAVTQASSQQLVEVEVALRGIVARFAARHATDDQLADLSRLLDEADDALRIIDSRRADGLPIDVHVDLAFAIVQAFNRAVGACTHNPVLIRLLDQSRALSTAERRERTSRRFSSGERFGRARWEGHRALVEAIRHRDEVEAERIATQHAEAALLDLAAGLSGARDVVPS